MWCVVSLTINFANNVYICIYNIFYVQEVLDLRKSRLLQYLNMQLLSNRANYIYPDWDNNIYRLYIPVHRKLSGPLSMHRRHGYFGIGGWAVGGD